jgi:hypothetical protein
MIIVWLFRIVLVLAAAGTFLRPSSFQICIPLVMIGGYIEGLRLCDTAPQMDLFILTVLLSLFVGVIFLDYGGTWNWITRLLFLQFLYYITSLCTYGLFRLLSRESKNQPKR